ncbi:50S ribosomal protein L29 [Candidatus Woesebacteria bacterium]|nr:50S ribosomal protein L29 [Candidatus Woesebacteria bacterium]
MKRKELKNLNDKTASQLKEKAGKDKQKLRELMAEFYGKGDKNPENIRQLKKDIAQTLTILRQKEIQEKYNQAK